MKKTREELSTIRKEIARCCHCGHGASVFTDGSVYYAVSVNDCLAVGDSTGKWDYRIAYYDRVPSLEALEELFSQVQEEEKDE